MIKIKPVITEKSLSEAKKGNYTFYLARDLNKEQIKKLIGETFGVDVLKVRTINLKTKRKKNFRGRIQILKPRKKAIVTLKENQKIDLFEEKKS